MAELKVDKHEYAFLKATTLLCVGEFQADEVSNIGHSQ
jgi:hypothetical protein